MGKDTGTWRDRGASYRPPAVLMYLLLLFGVLLAYGPVAYNGFLTYDDSLYVTANPHIRPPFGLESFRWAFTTFHAANWHPLTWLSHMMDVALFGVNPRGHHLTNLLIHAVNTLLLYATLSRMTGEGGRSALVAALFALHPLHVESVAWVAERKDVLCGLFFLLSIRAYDAYGRAPSLARYAAVTALFLLSLMAKPMAVTLPCVLLLLDYWPLRRWQGGVSPRTLRLVCEKVPWLFLSAISCVVTVAAQRYAGAIQSVEVFPWPARFANIARAYLQYLGKTFWPVGLSAFYPHPGVMTGTALWGAGLGLSVLLLLSVGVWRLRRRMPYLVMGWGWFLGMLVPVIGIVQVGAQGMADRYTYLPLIGVFVAATWALADIGQAVALPKVRMAALAVAVVAVCGALTSAQVRYWKDSVVLFTHAIETTGPNEFVRCALGKALLEQGRLDDAAIELQAALRLDPEDAYAYTALGVVYLKQELLAEAEQAFEQALRRNPDDEDAHVSLGNVLNRLGRSAEAARHYEAILRRHSDSASAHAGLGAALLNQGDRMGARRELEEALRLDTRLAAAHVNYGIWLRGAGANDDALSQLAEALRLDPSNAVAHLNMGLAFAAASRYAEAEGHFREALRLVPANAEACNGLGVVLRNLGRNTEAIQAFDDAINRDPQHVTAYLNLADMYRLSNDTGKALACLQRALAIQPGDPRVRALLDSVEQAPSQ